MCKKTVSALLVLALALGLMTACGGETSESPGDSGAATPEYVYVPSYAPLSMDDSLSYIQTCVWHDGKIYFIASVEDGTETYSYPTSETDLNGDPVIVTGESPIYRTGLFSANEDGTGVTELPAYASPQIPEGQEGSASVNRMLVDDQGDIWVYENLYTYSYDLPEDFDETTQNKWDYYVESGNQYFIRRLDPTGAQLASVDLSFLQGENEYFYLNSFTIDGAGNIYLSDGDGNVYVLDGTGNELFRIEASENWVNGMVNFADGSVAVQSYDQATSASVFKRIDLAAKGYGESVPAPYNAYNFYPGSGDYDFYYGTDSSFFGYDTESGTPTKLITWINCDVDNNNFNAIMPLPDGRILCVYTEYDDTDGTNTTQLLTMTKTPYSETAQKTTLTYACMYLDWNIRSQIVKFNRSNPDYRIEVMDYSEYNTQEDYNAGLTKLTTEILSGKVPDIMDTNTLPILQYAAKGLLEDLWPYIDADTELGGRDGLVSPVFSALEQDGKLYQICPGFSITTVIGASSVVGDEPGWTLDDLYAALEKMPEGAEIFSMGTVSLDMLNQCCALGMDDFVNWGTGECTFDSPEFIKILEFADQFPDTFDWQNIKWDSGDYEDESTRIMAGKQMLAQFYASDFQNFQMYKALFGGDITFVGFPTESRNGSAFQLSSGLALSSACQYKDAAWQFMRTLLTEDYQTNNVWTFPTNKATFDAKLKTAMTPIYTTDPATGAQVEQSQGTWGWGDLQVEIYALTQEEADQFLALINSTNRVYSYDQSLMGIITDETEAFFAGQKSAEDTAAMIQSRASLYVNEQR